MMVLQIRVVTGLVITTDEGPSPHVTIVRVTCMECITVKE